MTDNKFQIGGTHYTEMNIQPWDVIDGWPLQCSVGFYRGNILKYIIRAGEKGDAIEDLQKARHYIDKLIKVLAHAEKPT